MSSPVPFPKTWQELAGRLEFANLQCGVRQQDLRLLCLEAQQMGVEVVVVHPVHVPYVAGLLVGTPVKVAAAISFPVGGDPADHKEQEVREAVEDGADLIYMLMSVGAFRDEWFEQQTIPEIRGMVRSAQSRPTRLITEASVLTPEQKQTLCRIARQEGVQALVATSGFGRSHLPALTPQDFKDLVDAADGGLEVMTMDEAGTLDGLRAYFEQGVSRVCSQHVRQLWLEMSAN